LKEISKEIYTIANITFGIIGWVGKCWEKIFTKKTIEELINSILGCRFKTCIPTPNQTRNQICLHDVTQRWRGLMGHEPHWKHRTIMRTCEGGLRGRIEWGQHEILGGL
jgi:hypothetical protein